MGRRKYSPEERAAAKERRRVKGKEWRATNAEAIAIVAKRWRANNRDKVNRAAVLWRAKHPERAKVARQKYEEANVERRRALRKEWKAKHRESYAAWCAEYRTANKDRVNAAIREWGINNPDRRRATWQKRYARLLGQLHPDNDVCAEREIYRLARNMTRTSGIVYHVDHIIPLDAGGWHHHLNLQVLPYQINTAKGANPFWELEGYRCWKNVPAFLWPAAIEAEYRNRLENIIPLDASA